MKKKLLIANSMTKNKQQKNEGNKNKTLTMM